MAPFFGSPALIRWAYHAQGNVQIARAYGDIAHMLPWLVDYTRAATTQSRQGIRTENNEKKNSGGFLLRAAILEG